jgi:glutamyl/glutaminyl-tRNA synthetase
MQLVKLSEVKLNPNNPRLIKDDKFKKLVQSIKDFPEMLNIRPIVVNQDMIILGGNMRYKACKEAGLKEIPVIITNLSEDQQREFLIKDNTSGGEWDWNILANEWDSEQLEAWGLDVPISLESKDNNAEDIVEAEQSVQLIPGKEYLLIVFDNDIEFEQAKKELQLKMVRRGGYKEGSDFDSLSLERVLYFSDFKNRLC